MTKEIKISNSLHVQISWESEVKRPQRISNMTHIPLRTCQRFVSMLNSGEKLERKAGSGGQNKTVPRVERKLIKKVRSSKTPISLRTMAKKLKLGKSTLWIILKNNGFRYKRIKRPLSEEAKIRRVNFAQNMMGRISDVGFTIFSDETSFWINKSRPSHSWVCLESEEVPKFGKTGLHGPKIHVWGAISSRGIVSLKIFERNMDSQSYVNILREKKAEMLRLYPEGFIFMQDNDPKHTSNIAKNYINSNFMELLDWPPYSPDLNPIEEIWSWLKRRVSQEIPKNIKQLKNCILKYWRTITPETLAPYINSL